MAKFLNKIFHEQGTQVLNITFKDERKKNIIPKTSQFQLMKLDRTIIGTRTFANGNFTGNRVVLSGDDLAIFGDDDTCFRLFAVRITYDSTYGNDLPGNCETEFVITRVLNIPDNAPPESPVEIESNFGGALSIVKTTLKTNLDGDIDIKNSYNLDGIINIIKDP